MLHRRMSDKIERWYLFDDRERPGLYKPVSSYTISPPTAYSDPDGGLMGVYASKEQALQALRIHYISTIEFHESRIELSRKKIAESQKFLWELFGKASWVLLKNDDN